MLLLLRLTGRKRRPGPTSTRWIVAFAKRTVVVPPPGDMGREMGELGGEDGGEVGEVPSRDGEEGGRPGLVGSPVSGLRNCFGRLWPSGLDTRRIDLGMGMGALEGLE